jgi:bifunctional non-homologous end joining protein LigD
VTVYTRNGHDRTEEFATIAAAAARLDVEEAILDGEATVLGSTGVADFQALRRELGNQRRNRVLFFAFDLLWLDGADLRPKPLIDRKGKLQVLLDQAPPTII